jgi:hypothetical protein
MTLEQAQEVKDILKTIHDHIPATHVDRIFHYYKSYVNPDANKPCTCSPKDWNRMLIELKDKVENTLNQVTANEAVSHIEENESGWDTLSTTATDTGSEVRKRGRRANGANKN